MSEIPEKMLAWPLFGVGLDKIGCDGKPCVVDVPEIKRDELLVKIDAIGLCFSDIKLIRAGEEHPRVISKNLAEDPVIPGHEAVMTVVKVGDDLKNEYSTGQRYIIQADIYVNGEGFAYGYAIDGGMAQYSVVDQRVLNGDEGCYLLPLADETPAGLAALIEPWTCVIASHLIENRVAPEAGGSMLIACEPGDSTIYEPGGLLLSNPPASITCLSVNAETLDGLKSAFSAADFAEIESVPDAGAYDDVFLCAIKERARAEKLSKLCARNATINLIGEYHDEEWSIDVGNIHYDGWFYQGTSGANLSEAYGRNVRSVLRKGGVCWLPGGAGAMGQMHTQLAVEDPNGPSRILVTDLDDARIAKVVEGLADKIRERNIDFNTLNPKHFESPEAFHEEVARFAGGDGFDDIVMLVPVIPVLNDAAKLLKKDGLMNIFAGIPAGKEGLLNVAGIARDGHRYIGSSGSRTSDLRYTLSLVEKGELTPATALAAIGGMRSLKEGLDGVANARFPGKTVVFPHCENLPLTPVGRIGELDESVADSLRENTLYNLETEKALFAKFADS
ncbi:MAG: alcohol dehydrogenase catalytic domain-containing protein [Kiritimatiellaeota bacterium]|nr:alcohol dehydrogenase catalytic domain-containing protein [Kiritimatiellota bacterium]